MSRTPRYMVAGAGVCVAGFFALMAVAYFAGPARWLDAAALDGFIEFGSPHLSGVANVFAHAGDPFPYVLFGGAAIAVAFATRGLRTGAAVTLLLGGANVSSQVLKPLFPYHRELWNTEFHLYPVHDASYPSGHATAVMALALAAMIIAPRAHRTLVAAIGCAFTLTVTFSLLMLSWHLPSDVVGGFFVATAWGLVSLAALNHANERWPREGSIRDRAREAMPAPPPIAALATVALVLTAAAAVALATDNRLASFADRHTAFVAVAGAIAVTAAVLLAAVVSLSSRPSS